MKSSNSKLLIFLLILYLGLSPVAWFGFSTLGVIKRFLLILIILVGYKRLRINCLKEISLVVLAYTLLIISLYVNPPQEPPVSLISGIIENIIFFTLGYNFASQQDLTDDISKKALYVLSLFCLITIVSFFTGIPAWNAPSMQMIEKEMGVIIQEYDKLYQTGFSWSRSGWGISMSLFLPLLFLFNKQNTKNFRKVILAFIFVLFSLFLCGNRSGLLGFIIACFLIFRNDEINYHFRKYKTKAYIIIAVLLIVFTPFVIKNLRLDTDDISANRLDMFVYLPNLIQGIEFWGIGMGESKELLRRVGALDFQFHNTPINSIIEFGWLYGLSIVIIMISIFSQYLKRYKQDPQVAVYGAILISGIVTSMFEPAAIFGYLGGYCLWWFAYGIFVAKYKH